MLCKLISKYTKIIRNLNTKEYNRNLVILIIVNLIALSIPTILISMEGWSSQFLNDDIRYTIVPTIIWVSTWVQEILLISLELFIFLFLVRLWTKIFLKLIFTDLEVKIDNNIYPMVSSLRTELLEDNKKSVYILDKKLFYEYYIKKDKGINAIKDNEIFLTQYVVKNQYGEEYGRVKGIKRIEEGEKVIYFYVETEEDLTNLIDNKMYAEKKYRYISVVKKRDIASEDEFIDEEV